MGDVNKGNFQDISVHDKEVAALGATKEAQDMSTLNRVVVPKPAFNDPNDPTAAAGSINLSLGNHPSEHPSDYGQEVQQAVVTSTMDVESAAAKTSSSDAAPEDRADWQKKHWQSAASEYGLATSGNTDTVKARVEEHEARLEAAKQLNAGDWTDEIEDVDDAEELAELRSLYDASGSDYSTVVQAFDAKAAEFAGGGSSDEDPDKTDDQ